MTTTKESGREAERAQQLRHLPQIGQLLEAPQVQSLLEGGTPRPLIVRELRWLVERLRGDVLSGAASLESKAATMARLVAQLEPALGKRRRGKLHRVINGTGVVINTNLGRSPLPPRAIERIGQVAGGYCNLEYDLPSRARGGRMEGVEELLCELSGAEAAYVVNNNAAAVMLALRTMAHQKEAVISRSELVEIGGSFRVPEVMEAAGVKLREVGTTNRTHLRDYEGAIGEDTGLLLKVHQSNFAILGFTKEVGLDELVALGARRQLPVLVDLGSGSISDFEEVAFAPSPFGFPGEPTMREIASTGVDLLTCSGDKLLGGPQAGILLGRKEWIQAAARQPITRALRVDKLTLAALEATLQVYVEEGPEAWQQIPIWAQMRQRLEQLRERSEAFLAQLGDVAPLEIALQESPGKVGGGALPTALLPSLRLVLSHPQIPVETLERELRHREMPIVGLLERDRLMLDMRTIHPEEWPYVRDALHELKGL